jgi:hypothetical protein
VTSLIYVSWLSNLVMDQPKEIQVCRTFRESRPQPTLNLTVLKNLTVYGGGG